ncbi:MAG: septum formation initiator family protein [Puniceicoccales bacterium]|jgi:hypothetical protein|nr:septum formation initiator family protein [Puniceicoccales bacterium]
MRLTPGFWNKTFFSLLMAVIALGSVLFFQKWTASQYRLSGLRGKQQTLENEVAGLELEKRHQQEYLDRIKNDPGFFRRVVREHLGFALPGEIMIQVETPRSDRK